MSVTGLFPLIEAALEKLTGRKNMTFQKTIYGILCFFTALSALLFVLGIPIATAEEATSVRPNISIENVSAVDGKLAANITVHNTTGFPLNNVLLSWTLEESAQIFGNDLLPGSVLAIGRSPLSDGQLYFSLRSGESISAPLLAQYPKGAATADGRLSVELVDIGATVVGAVTQQIALRGNEGILSFDNALCALHVKTIVFSSAPILFPDEIPAILCQISNQSNQTITATPLLRVGAGALYHTDALVKEEKGNPITLAPFETRIVDIEFPSAPSAPQQYESALTLLDGKGNPVSPIKMFSWAVQGPSATITRVQFDKDGYRKGESAQVVIAFSQSADIPLAKNATDAQRTGEPSRWIGTPLSAPHISLIIRDGDGQVCGTQNASLLPPNNQIFQETFEVIMSKNCVNPSAEITVSEQENVLAVKAYRAVSSIETTKQLQQNTLWYLLGGFVAFVFFALAAVLLRNKYRPRPPIISPEINTQSSMNSRDILSH